MTRIPKELHQRALSAIKLGKNPHLVVEWNRIADKINKEQNPYNNGEMGYILID